MSKESQLLEWWEPPNLRENEKKARGKYTAEDFNSGDDFGSYKAIKEGVSFEESGLISHNMYKDKNLKQAVSDYIKILKNVNYKSPKAIADFGCGAGFTTKTLKQIYPEAEVSGFEISHDAIDYAKRNFQQCRFEQRTIELGTQISSNKFDLILCQGFYPFVRTNDVKKHTKWLELLLEHLANGGIAIITDAASNQNSINYSYQRLKNDFTLKRYTLAIPRISSKLPLYLSMLAGRLALKIFPKASRQIYLLMR
jgi:predicted O-methyltransferase YrrM